jgi:hypothetical protein
VEGMSCATHSESFSLCMSIVRRFVKKTVLNIKNFQRKVRIDIS